jgi:membrane protein implicated in regulation of membrane protease activity
LADDPQETIRELRQLVVAYAKQETIEPIMGLGHYAFWGLTGAFLMGMGALFAEIGFLRLMQYDTFPHLTGNWSWLPYVTVVVASVLLASVIWAARRKRKSPST